MPALVASTTTRPWPWTETEVASPAAGTVPPLAQLTPPSVDSTTVFVWVAPAALVALVHTRTSWAWPAASRAPVGWPSGPGAPGAHGSLWLAAVQAAPVSGPLYSAPDGASR